MMIGKKRNFPTAVREISLALDLQIEEADFLAETECLLYNLHRIHTVICQILLPLPQLANFITMLIIFHSG